jgi:hypothetical protein
MHELETVFVTSDVTLACVYELLSISNSFFATTATRENNNWTTRHVWVSPLCTSSFPGLKFFKSMVVETGFRFHPSCLSQEGRDAFKDLPWAVKVSLQKIIAAIIEDVRTPNLTMLIFVALLKPNRS